MENNGTTQLDLIAQARAAVAARLITPWWYHPSLGLLLAGYVIGLSLGGAFVRAITMVVFFAGCAALMQAYRRVTGVWVSGFEAGRAGRWAQALGALAAVTLTSAWGIVYWTDLTWPAWALAALVFVGTVVLGRRFDSALRAQLRAGA